MKAKISTVAGAVAAVMLMLLGALAVAPTASAAADLNSSLETEQGTTTILGGGDHFFVKFGSDAAFGIVWGTNDTPNNVYFVTIKARYLGVAQVYDQTGKLVEKDHAVKIYTMYAVKLDDVLEFDDQNRDLVLPYYRSYNDGAFTGEYTSMEQLFKMVDLKTAWTASEVTSADTDIARTWTFSLTAKNLSYAPLDNYTGPAGDDVLNEFSLTFHLEARMVQVDNATIPQWRITVTKSGMANMTWFSNAEKAPDVIMSGKMLSYHVKYDSSIIGWDYDAANGNPALLMEFSAVVGDYIPKTMATWMEMRMIRAMNENAVMTCKSGSSEVDENGTTGVYGTPKPVTTPLMNFAGERTRVGQFAWVSDVDVDGVQTQLRAQIMAGVPVTAIGANGALFHGFAVLGGIAYPGGASIIHDPTVTSEALVDLQSSSGLPGILVIGLIAAVIVVIVAAVMVLTGKKPGQKAPQSYERKGSQSEWSKYYEKK